MFERYTEKARRVIFFARYEASQVGSAHIESEHLLYGLLRERGDGVGKFAVGVAEQLWSEVRARSKPETEKVSSSADLPLSNASKRILAYAAEEAERLSHRHIGTEHLMLGLLRERGTVACEVLEKHGIELEALRSELARKALSEPAYRQESTQFERLLYNPASEMLIAEIKRFGRMGPISRISVRHISTDEYEPIGKPFDNISYESAVTCELQPIVLFLTTRWNGRSGEAENVLAYNLKTKELTVAMEQESLPVEGQHVKAWIAKLHSLSADGTVLYFTVAVERGESPGADLEYSLAKMDLTEKTLEVLARLRNVSY